MNVYPLIRPMLFSMDPETVHHRAMATLAFMSRHRWLLPLIRQQCRNPQPVELFGLTFPNRIGLAAGFDKNAVALAAWEAIGFGFIEAGTITAKAQPGNPSPRIFRYPDHEALVNRLGFNNDGADVVAGRLKTIWDDGRRPAIPVGINIGKSKVTPLEKAVDDYLHSFEKLYPFADYFVLNVSSPNTPGLRSLQEKPALDQLLKAIMEYNRSLDTPRPVLLKVAPDLEDGQLDDILDLATAHRLQGLIATNTTVDHATIPQEQRETGGLSGRPLFIRSTDILRYLAGKTDLPIIAAGGVMDEESARAKFDAGASLLQLYTGFVYRGPELVKRLAMLSLK